MRRHIRKAAFRHASGEVPPVNTTRPDLKIDAVIEDSQDLQR